MNKEMKYFVERKKLVNELQKLIAERARTTRLIRAVNRDMENLDKVLYL